MKHFRRELQIHIHVAGATLEMKTILIYHQYIGFGISRNDDDPY